jgi:hypothetical protein
MPKLLGVFLRIISLATPLTLSSKTIYASSAGRWGKAGLGWKVERSPFRIWVETPPLSIFHLPLSTGLKACSVTSSLRESGTPSFVEDCKLRMNPMRFPYEPIIGQRRFSSISQQSPENTRRGSFRFVADESSGETPPGSETRGD